MFTNAAEYFFLFCTFFFSPLFFFFCPSRGIGERKDSKRAQTLQEYYLYQTRKVCARWRFIFAWDQSRQ